eukprot:snap_masked-scaffold_26-processed-gene-2.41-mRNA-1 protein AED:0.95 eAED:1.00 QI:0/-1/0/1/-1/1/1/0/276
MHSRNHNESSIIERVEKELVAKVPRSYKIIKKDILDTFPYVSYGINSISFPHGGNVMELNKLLKQRYGETSDDENVSAKLKISYLHNFLVKTQKFSPLSSKFSQTFFVSSDLLLRDLLSIFHCPHKLEKDKTFFVFIVDTFYYSNQISKQRCKDLILWMNTQVKAANQKVLSFPSTTSTEQNIYLRKIRNVKIKDLPVINNLSKNFLICHNMCSCEHTLEFQDIIKSKSQNQRVKLIFQKRIVRKLCSVCGELSVREYKKTPKLRRFCYNCLKIYS